MPSTCCPAALNCESTACDGRRNACLDSIGSRRNSAILTLPVLCQLVCIPCRRRPRLGCRWLTDALQDVSERSGISEAFIGLIILPIAGNAVEHLTAVYVAVRNKMDLAIAVALGSSIQISLFVIPIIVGPARALGLIRS